LNRSTSEGGSAPFLLLIVLTAAGPLGTQLVAPVLPAVAQAFEADRGTVGLTMALYLAGLGTGQLIYGPLSDRYGRRPVLLAGLSIFVLAGVIVSVSGSMDVLLAGRAAQGLGAAAGIPIARAILRDCHGPERTAGRLGYLKAAVILVPMAAPPIGGWIEGQWDWRAVFIALTVVSAGLLAWVGWGLRESLREQRDTGLARHMRDSAALLATRAFLGHALQVSFSSAAFFCLLGAGAFVAAEAWNAERAAFGIGLTIVSAGYGLGNVLTGLLAERLGPSRLLRCGVALAPVFTLAMVILALLDPSSPWPFVILAALMSVAQGLAIPTGFGGAIEVDPRRAGAASGLTGALQLGMGAAVAGLAGYLASDSVLLLALFILAASILAWAVSFLGRHPSSPSEVA